MDFDFFSNNTNNTKPVETMKIDYKDDKLQITPETEFEDSFLRSWYSKNCMIEVSEALKINTTLIENQE